MIICEVSIHYALQVFRRDKYRTMASLEFLLSCVGFGNVNVPCLPFWFAHLQLFSEIFKLLMIEAHAEHILNLIADCPQFQFEYL